MNFGLFLSAALLTCCTGKSSVHDPPQRILAFAGGDVILPCSFNITDKEDFPTVEWSKEGLQPDVVFLYRDGCETYEMKNPAFEYRTSFITKELKNGNISLRISDVQLSDEGRYRCMRIWGNGIRDVTTVELVVGAVSEPKLSVVPADSGGLTLQCDATCWLPEPDIKFLDHQGNDIPADDPKRHQNGSRCYTVTRRVTLQDQTSRVTCRVQQLKINQTRDAEILLPADCMTSCSVVTGIAVGEAVLLLLLLSGLGFVWKKCGISVGQQKLPVSRQSSDQSTSSRTSEKQPFLQNSSSKKTNSVGNRSTDSLIKEVADLKSQLRQKEETIRRLQSNNESPLSPVVFQFDQPTIPKSPAASTNSKHPESPKSPGPSPAILRQNSSPASGHPIQRKHRNNSSPARLNLVATSSFSSFTSKKSLVRTDRSLSESRPGPNIPNLHHQPSLVSTLSNNRFRPLLGLTEESEKLMQKRN